MQNKTCLPNEFWDHEIKVRKESLQSKGPDKISEISEFQIKKFIIKAQLAFSWIDFGRLWDTN
jgi:hypothetical protein